MAVRANWHVPSTSARDGDPLAGAPQRRVEDVGKPIDLTGPPKLNERLVELVGAEGALADRGVTCAIKDRADTTCSACPIACVDEIEPIAALCRVGKEQERVLTLLAVHQARGT